MKRRDFLKKSAIGPVAASIFPESRAAESVADEISKLTEPINQIKKIIVLRSNL